MQVLFGQTVSIGQCEKVLIFSIQSWGKTWFRVAWVMRKWGSSRCVVHECLVLARLPDTMPPPLKCLFEQLEVTPAVSAEEVLILQSVSFTQHWRCSCCIWIISGMKRWRDLDLESGTQRWKDNSCKCHKRGQGLTSLELPVGETDGRERWHLTSLERSQRRITRKHANASNSFHLTACLCFKPAYCDRKGQQS